jgi:hypothetical protein
VPLRSTKLLVLAGAALLCACVGEPRAADATPVGAAAPSGGVVDSALPIPVLLDRFRATVTDTPTVMRGGAASPRALAAALLSALTQHDTAAVRALAVSRAEFAWLYYPHTRYTAPPYELGPELVWLQQVLASEKGAVRLLRRYGGQRLTLGAVTCPDPPTVEGPNHLLAGCRVRFSARDSGPVELRLFGALLNHDGQYKFLSYANDL